MSGTDDGASGGESSTSREIPLLMPKMSMTMEEGELISWHAAEGDEVSAGDVIAEVMTDKVDMDVEAPVDGVLVRIVADARATVAVGAPIAYIRTEADDLMAGLFDAPDGDAAPATDGATDSGADVGPEGAAPDAAMQEQPASTGGGTSTARPVAATPVSRRGPQPAVPFARRRAAELRVALSSIEGSGPDGLVTVDDVERAAGRPQETASDPAAAAPTAPDSTQAAASPDSAAAQKPAPSGASDTAPDGVDPAYADELAARRRSVRSVVARTMTASTAVPQFTVFTDLDLDRLSRERGRIGWTTLLVRAVAIVLRGHPDATTSWDEESGRPGAAPEQLGVAVAVDSAIGLLAPVVTDADRTATTELDEQVRSLISRARTGRLKRADLDHATTTLSNLGGFGVPSFTSLLTPPQSTALSVGAIEQRPIVVGGGLGVGLRTTVGLTVDHRTVDGADAARILADLNALVRDPDRLLA